MISKSLYSKLKSLIASQKYYLSNEETFLLKTKIGGVKPGEVLSKRG